MGILDFLTGELIDVIHWTGDDRNLIVSRFEREGHEIKYGAKLTVREGQAAVFIHEGRLADVFPPGLYMLETNNMPILTSMNHWDHGFKSPFKSEIYFVNTTRFQDLKWGTKNPIIIRDPEFGPTRLRAFGTYTVRVNDPGKFMVEIVGTDNEFTMDEISFQIRNIIVSHFSTTIARCGIPVLDMAANTPQLSELLAKWIAPEIAEYGLTLPSLYIENISLPDTVEAALDKRTSMGIVGNLNQFSQYSMAEALTLGAKIEGGNALNAGVGMGIGVAMSQNLNPASAGPWGQAPAQITPPPLPVEKLWHIAADGVSTGPYSRADLGRMANDNKLSRDTLVWSAGVDGWTKAGDINELAQLFTIMPPPAPSITGKK